MKKKILYLIILSVCCASHHIAAQTGNLDSIMPTRGLFIGVPKHENTDKFVEFIDHELAPRKVNKLILMIDYNYKYKSHPELVNENALTFDDAKKIVVVCKKNKISIIPYVDFFGHQSWKSSVGKLLAVYPQFDETPNIKFPTEFVWPNADNLYCKSYCPLHPQLHPILFDIVDELVDVFEASDFNAGMDEVHIIGDSKCPRCAGKDKAELYANEVTLFRDHLAKQNKKLWIWGDRLLDGRTSGVGGLCPYASPEEEKKLTPGITTGIFEASFNGTHRAIDLIPKDVVIFDWHYEQNIPSAVMFAMKGISVITCTYQKADLAVAQARDQINWRKNTPAPMSNCFLGMTITIWSSNEDFINDFYKSSPSKEVATFMQLFDEINKHAKN